METNIDQAAGVIVKSDRTGRTRYTPEYKREVLAAFESSSLSAPVFARQCGIKYPNHLGLDPLSGAAFLFTSKSRRLIKIFYFDGTGYWLARHQDARTTDRRTHREGRYVRSRTRRPERHRRGTAQAHLRSQEREDESRTTPFGVAGR